jgi:hypothetical protein
MLQMDRVERARFSQLLCGPFEINRVPKSDCGDDQIQAAGSMTLVLERAIADLPEPIEEHSARE